MVMQLWRRRHVYQRSLLVNPNTRTSSKKVNKPKLDRVLLDSGSDIDLQFHRKGTHKCFPYLARLVPKSWCTLNGIFHTEGKGKLEIQFSDIVEYDNDSNKPAFDLIIGCHL
jgi:hypothetical protein